MDSFIKYQRTIMFAVIGVAIVACVLLLVFFPQMWSLATGVVFGVVGGLIVLRLKVLAIYRFRDNPERPPVKSGFQANLVMIAFLGAAILINKFLGVNRDILNVWTTLAGLILPNAVLMADGFFRPPVKDVSDTEEYGEK